MTQLLLHLIISLIANQNLIKTVRIWCLKASSLRSVWELCRNRQTHSTFTYYLHYSQDIEGLFSKKSKTVKTAGVKCQLCYEQSNYFRWKSRLWSSRSNSYCTWETGATLFGNRELSHHGFSGVIGLSYSVNLWEFGLLLRDLLVFISRKGEKRGNDPTATTATIAMLVVEPKSNPIILTLSLWFNFFE